MLLIAMVLLRVPGLPHPRAWSIAMDPHCIEELGLKLMAKTIISVEMPICTRVFVSLRQIPILILFGTILAKMVQRIRIYILLMAFTGMQETCTTARMVFLSSVCNM